VPVAHACNPSYSGGRHQEDQGLKPAWANNFQGSILKKQTGVGDLAQWKSTCLASARPRVRSLAPKKKGKNRKKKKQNKKDKKKNKATEKTNHKKELVE
jgi:hypothetical protein